MPIPTTETKAGYTSAELNFDWTWANRSKWSAMRRKTSTARRWIRPPHHVHIQIGEDAGCLAIESDRLRPSITSC